MASRGLFSDADGSFGGKRTPMEGELDMTPMIDVTFLLLIFFMLSTRFIDDGRVDLQRNHADVVGSVAHYMAAHGWQRDMPTTYDVLVPVDAAQMRNSSSDVTW